MIKTFFIELPTERLKGSIFYHLSPPVDYVGPLWIKVKVEKKGWENGFITFESLNCYLKLLLKNL